jgi:hypothetical protein
MMYLLTAIGLPPDGTQKCWKRTGHAPSLRVIPWHFPYNKENVHYTALSTEARNVYAILVGKSEEKSHLAEVITDATIIYTGFCNE